MIWAYWPWVLKHVLSFSPKWLYFINTTTTTTSSFSSSSSSSHLYPFVVDIRLFFQSPEVYSIVSLSAIWVLQIETDCSLLAPLPTMSFLHTQKNTNVRSGAEQSSWLYPEDSTILISCVFYLFPPVDWHRPQAKGGIILFLMCFRSAERCRVNKSNFPVDFKSSRMGCLTIPWEHCWKKKNPCIGWELHSNRILVQLFKTHNCIT